MRVVSFLVLLALASSQYVGCDDCNANNYKCVGEGDFCVFSLGDAFGNGCQWHYCPTCSSPDMICYQNQCRIRSAEEDQACCRDNDGLCDLDFCKPGLTCAQKQNSATDLCISNSKLSGVEGTYAGVSQEFDLDPTSGQAMCLGNLQSRSTECKFIDAGTVIDNGCIEDNDCPYGYYCPDIPQGETYASCELNYQKDLNTLPNGFGTPEGAPCPQLGSMRCGTDFICRRAWPFDNDNTTAICKKRFSGKLNDHCVDHDECGSGLFCHSSNPNSPSFCEKYPDCAGEDDLTGSSCLHYGFANQARSPLTEACLAPVYDTARGDRYCVPSGSFFGYVYGKEGRQLQADWARCMGNIKNSCPGNVNDGIGSEVYFSKCSRDNCISSSFSSFQISSCSQLNSQRAPTLARRVSAAPARLGSSKALVLLSMLVSFTMHL